MRITALGYGVIVKDDSDNIQATYGYCVFRVKACGSDISRVLKRGV